MSDISTVSTRFNGADLEFLDKATGTVVFAFRKAAGSLPVESALDGLTAFATGGQSGALPITAAISRLTTVGTTGDSAVLPVSTPGLILTIINAAASNSMNVFPLGTDKINALSASAAFAVAAGKTCQFTCTAASQWHTLLSA
jgi:hypothetical protein